MDEEGAANAPVSRLRRRLSVELSEDTKSPSAPSTPTKKRGGRLATKPQLELIDENFPQNSPKRATRKSIARDIAEPAAEKVATPARRTARILSDTSIVLETAQAIDSSRAMRAARKNSQTAVPATDTPVTPARIRRTRKDSSTSNDKVETEPAKKPPDNTAISEEPESNLQLSKTITATPNDTDAKKTPVPQNSPKRATRKSIARDIAEPAAEKAATPARRTARILSNTSVVSGTAQAFDSPRAKRAARRNSQLGSDNEAPATPVTKTRRTRKYSGADNLIETEPANKPPLVDVVISEEQETDLQQSKTITETLNKTHAKKTPDSLRKSPRLETKTKSISKMSENNDRLSQENEPVAINGNEKSKTTMNSSASPKNKSVHKDEIDGSRPQKNDLSQYICTVNLVKDFGTQAKIVSSKMNKTTSALDNGQNVISKRHRTNSWTTHSTPQTNAGNLCEGNYFSDQESLKKKYRNREKNSHHVGAGDNFLEKSYKSESLHGMERKGEILLNVSLEKNKSRKKNLLSSDNINVSVSANTNDSGNVSVTKIHKPLDSSNESNKNLLELSPKNNDCDAPELLFNKKPSSDIQSTILIEDSDSDCVHKPSNDKELFPDDQCVPVVEHDLQQATSFQNNGASVVKLEIHTHNFAEINKAVDKSANNDSCEPMDVDETMPENVVLNDSTEKANVDTVETQGVAENNANETNKSKRKSSISQNLESTSNENKSILVLSEIKDTSSSDHNESICIQESNKSFIPISGKEVVNNNLSLNCLTSTPVQQKDLKKMALQLNTSVFTPNSDSKNKDNKMSPLKAQSKPSGEPSKVSDNSDSSEEEEERGERKLSWVDDEAEDAGEDYESGDSRDEEERLYEKENEIVDKGETLTSDNDLSDDSDYEKDSFVVSSDEEDNDLLSGSGDDLDLSDNELNMSAKSKKKYNERCKKQQQKASREMFEARHKLNASDKSTKSKKTVSRLDSTQESDNEVMVPPKKNKRMRLDSTWDSSVTDETGSTHNSNVIEANNADKVISNKKEKRSSVSTTAYAEKEAAASENRDSSINESIMSEIGHKKKKKSKRLSESICDNALDEESTDISEKKIDNEIGHKKKSNRESICDNVVGDETTAISEKTDSTVNEFGHNNQKKSKRLSESICDNALDHDCAATSVKTDSILNKIGHKKKKNQRLSATIGGDVSNQIEIAAFEMKDLVNNESLTDSKKKKSKRLSESICGNALDENDKSVTIDSGHKKKKKNKRLSESLCNDSAMNENEITVFDDERMLQTDPLSMQVKQEVKTPQKALDISTIHFTDRDEVEHMHIDENASMMIPNETSDPLQTTMAQNNEDHDDDDESSISENEEIMENYDSVLKKLNEDSKIKRIKPSDLSLNLDRKAKKIREPIIDQLNITQTKTSKKKKKSKTADSEPEKPNTKYPKSVVTDFDEATSDSIDLKLLLSEDSNDSDKRDVMCDPEDESPEELPTKKTEDKTNILIHMDGNEIVANESLLNTSSNKKKKHRKSSQNGRAAIAAEGDMFFVDTTDSLLNSPANGPLNTSSMNNKGLGLPFGKDTDETVAKKDPNIVVENEQVGGSKKRKRKSSGHIDIDQATMTMTEDQAEVLEVTSRKKKRKISHDVTDNAVPTETLDAVSNNLEDNTQVAQKMKGENKSKKNKKGKRVEKLEPTKTQISEPEPEKRTGGRKRKQRDDDDTDKTSKVLKQNSFDKINVTRLPGALLSRLEDKPNNEVVKMKKSSLISTTRFLVEEARKRKNQPSNYLEQSVYLNDTQSPVEKKRVKFGNPKVLPFIPTASTSGRGFTTNFTVNVVPKTMEFVAQSTHTNNFKNDYINNKKIKKFSTYDLYKRHRNVKLSKF